LVAVFCCGNAALDITGCRGKSFVFEAAAGEGSGGCDKICVGAAGLLLICCGNNELDIAGVTGTGPFCTLPSNADGKVGGFAKVF
jgi:hypothetical protein